MPTGPVREEVLNVALAELLEHRGLLTLPEQIVSAVRGGRGRRLPDVTVGDLWGVRITIEGRISRNPGTRRGLLKDAKDRVEEGISPICLAVLYPTALPLTASYAALRKSLERAALTVRIVSESDEGDWVDTNVDGIAEILRTSYELLASEDVVAKSVDELRDSIESASAIIASGRAAPVRLRRLLGIPEDLSGHPESPEDEE
jgi:hypothetical protein